MKKLFLLNLIVIILPALSCHAADWPQWRGPALNGTSPDSDFPVKWSTSENVAWVAPLPGISGGTPVIWKDMIFLTASDAETYALTCLCISRANGKILWRKDADLGFAPKRGNHASSPSPVTDGKRVYFYFGTGKLIACDMDGKTAWDRNIAKDHGEFWIKFGYTSSPLLYNNRLYIPVIHGFRPKGTPKPLSYVLCVDADNGKDIWKQERNTEARYESPDAYSSPYLFETKKGPQIIINGADHVTAHDPETGKEIWRSDNYNKKNDKMYRTICSTTSWKGILFASEARGNSLFALPGDKTGQLADADRVWTVDKDAPDVCVPLVYQDRLFVLDGKRKVMTCRDPKTGESLGRRELPGSVYYYTSPTGGDGKIYMMNMDGLVVVLSADEKLTELNRVDMKEAGFGSSIALSKGQLFIRTNSKLYCVGQ